MFKNMTLATKQIGGFVVIALMIVIVGIIGINGLRTMGGAFDVVKDEEVPLADASMEAMIALISGRDLMGEFMLTEDLAVLDKAEKASQQSIADFDKYAEYIMEKLKGCV